MRFGQVTIYLLRRHRDRLARQGGDKAIELNKLEARRSFSFLPSRRSSEERSWRRGNFVDPREGPSIEALRTDVLRERKKTASRSRGASSRSTVASAWRNINEAG